jgi:hypothetical protein
MPAGLGRTVPSSLGPRLALSHRIGICRELPASTQLPIADRHRLPLGGESRGMSLQRDVGNLDLDPAIESVEFKATVRASQEEMVLADLRTTDDEPQRRRAYFFDNQSLMLYDAGVVLRARVTHDDADDSTVKLRPVVPAEIDRRWRETDGFEIELDMIGDAPICSAKLQRGNVGARLMKWQPDGARCAPSSQTIRSA